jgi:hypothetical protein
LQLAVKKVLLDHKGNREFRDLNDLRGKKVTRVIQEPPMLFTANG